MKCPHLEIGRELRIPHTLTGISDANFEDKAKVVNVVT
jgi:hypothetical protein